MRLIKKPTAKQYPGQHQPQRKRLTLERDGDVTLDYNPEIGSAVTMDRWHNVTPTISWDGYTKTSDIVRFYGRNKALFERVYDGRTIVWKGTDQVGEYNREAQKAIGRLEFLSTEMEKGESKQ